MTLRPTAEFDTPPAGAYTPIMRILLVNDDGIDAPGLAALYGAARGLGDRTVVAPDSPQSAAGRSMTLHEPLHVASVTTDGGLVGTSVSGRPVDCVKLAMRELLDEPPELVLAGINAGANVGINVFYSGTVAAAAEGAVVGVPSVAFSLAGGGDMDFARAGAIARWVLDRLLESQLRPGDLINVNIPALWRGEPKGVKFAPQGTAAITETYHRTDETDAELAFHLSAEYEHTPEEGETDVTALAEGYITLTALHSDLTDRSRMEQLRARDWRGAPE